MNKPNIETIRSLNLISAARWIAEQEGYDHNWAHALLRDLEVPANDCYINFYALDDEEFNEMLADGEDSLAFQFEQGLRKHYDLKSEDKLVLYISW